MNYVSLRTRNYFVRCPQRPRALLALCLSQLAAADTTGPITWAGWALRVPRTKALAATGHWRLQAGPRCDAGPSCARPAPAAGTRSYPVSSWPQWLTSSASARAATAPKALPPRPSFCIQQVFPCSHDAARSRGRWGSADAALGEGLQALSTLSAFSTQICVETCKGCRAQPAC